MKRNYQLAAASAFLLWLAWPPIPYTSLILMFALIPMLVVIDRIAGSELRNKGNKVFRATFLGFTLWNTACIYWVYNSLSSVMPHYLAVPISLIPFCLGSLLMAAAFWLYYRVKLRHSKWVAYGALISFWTAYEYLHQSWDLAFPWMNLGNGFAQTHYVVQWYQFTGVYGGTLWVLLVNILVYEGWKNYRSGKRLAVLAPSAAGILLPVAISLGIYYNYEEEENPANIVVVQPNIDPYQKFGSLSSELQIRQLISLSDSLGQPNTEYFIWPETAISNNTEEKNVRLEPNFIAVQNFLSKYKNGNVLSGIESYSVYDSAKTLSARFDEQSRKYYDVFNAAILIENSPKVQFYHKSKLVPGVEQIPFSTALSFIKPVFAAFGGSSGSYGKQDEPSVFYSQSGIGAAPVICYESIWGEYVAEYIRKDAQFIAIITNDGWWGNTSGKDQHFEYAKLRAIETRRWVARSANTGISGFINQKGDIVSQTDWWLPGALKADINLNEELTFYVRNGDIIARVLSVAALVYLGILLLGALRKKA